jgi:hypothetical protein
MPRAASAYLLFTGPSVAVGPSRFREFDADDGAVLDRHVGGLAEGVVSRQT